MRSACALVLVALACPAAFAQTAPKPMCPRPTTGPQRFTGEVWRVPMGSGTGGLVLDAAPGLVVAGLQGGRTVSIDVESGTTCAVLVDPPNSGPPPATVIDPYTARSKIAHGMLIGGGKGGIGAVDLWTGNQVWVHAPPVNDDFALRDGLHVVEMPASVVVAYRTQLHVGSRTQLDMIVAGLDPRTGRQLWRVIAATGSSMPIDGDVRIASDGPRVLVRTPASLRSLDGATGAEVWSQKLTPPTPVVGPRTPAMEAPRIASDGTYLALARPSVIATFDAGTRTMQQITSVAGMATELVVRSGVVYAALEASPGNASVVAIDASTRSSGRILWSQPVAHSITRMRVDHEHVYVVDGNGRLSALALSTGAPLFGVNANAFDFAIARTRAGTLRIAIPGIDLVAYEPPRAPAPSLAPYARWELEPRGDHCHPRALVWVDGDDKPVWRREMPKRLADMSLGRCGDLEVMAYLRHPRSNAHALYAILGVVDIGPALVEADATGLLVLKKSDGAITLDVDATRAGNSLFFDDGTFTLTALPGCTGPARRARVFHRCGDRFVYFNASQAVIVTVDPRTGAAAVEARASYTKAALVKGGVRTEAAFDIGRYRLELRGMTYMH